MRRSAPGGGPALLAGGVVTVNARASDLIRRAAAIRAPAGSP